jgi:outer membrane protein/protease secretion system outer membrane protein
MSMALPRIRPLAVALAAALLTQASAAQAVDLLESYNLALQNDGQLKAARARAEAGREALPQARSALMPNLSANYSYGRVDQERKSDGLSSSFDYNTRSLNVQATQPIYRKYNFEQLDEAKARVAGSDAQLDFDTQDMGSRVVQAYFDALFQRDRLRLIQAQAASVGAQLRSARLAFEAGTGTRTDIDELQAKLDVLAADEIQVRQGIVTTSEQLQVFTGQPVEALATINVAALDTADYEPGELRTWLDRVLETSPELRVQQSRVDQTQAGVGMAQAGHHPTLDLVVRYTDSLSDTPALVNSPGGFEIKSTFVGVQAQMPLFSGGRVNSEVRQALASAQQARETLAFGRNDAQLKVRREYGNVREGLARVRALEKALASAEQVVLANRKGVEAGTRTTLDVLNVEQQRYNTQVDLARSRYALLIAWGRLNGLAGGLNADEVARINRVLVTSQAASD